MRPKQKIIILIVTIFTILNINIVLANTPCTNNSQCNSNQICEDSKCKGKSGATCTTSSRTLTEAEWESYENNPDGPTINTRIDPSDNCEIGLFCDNKKKCCTYGACDWEGTQPNDPNPPSDPDTDPDDDIDPTNPTFDDGNSLDDTEFQGGVSVSRDESIDSGDLSTGGSGAGSENRTILLPDTELNDSNSSLLGEVERLINWTLGFLGILVFSMMLFAGFEYATAGGDEAKTNKAISRIKATVIGLVILFFAFVTTNLIVGLALGRI